MNQDAPINADIIPSPKIVSASVPKKILYSLIVVILPGLDFAAGVLLSPEWRSGQFPDYAALLLDYRVAYLFFPLLIFSILSFIYLLWSPKQGVPKFMIRLGIYTGGLLALQYTIIAAIKLPYSIAAGVVLVLVGGLIPKIRSQGGRILVIILLLAAGLGLAAAISSPASTTFLDLVFVIILVLCLGAPFLCFFMALLFAIRLFNAYDCPILFNASRAIGVGAWLSGYTAAWIVSINRMFEMYNALPKYPPDCYIATAAARGHPSFVGSHPIAYPGGTLWVNRQLQMLKCAELVLMAVAPRFHRPLRRLYDAIGPRLSRCLVHPVLADLAYLGFKPVELLFRFALRRLIPNLDKSINQFYRTV